jgi:hypothetical protein
MPSRGTQVVEWFFGRGLSISCGLTWFPREWIQYSRDEQILRIRETLPREMSEPNINTAVIGTLIDFLAARTASGWQHRFHTTNWDFLLQREISQHFPKGTLKPWWLASSHVFHHNGTVEILSDDTSRSQILLESDQESTRTLSIESEKGFSNLIWSRVFVVVGMSFECSVDRFLFKALSRVQEELPVGESLWIVVNPNAETLFYTRMIILKNLPSAIVRTCASNLQLWLAHETPELQSCGAISR